MLGAIAGVVSIGERTGTHTAGIVSRVVGRQVANYRSSRRQAGENVGALLTHHPPGWPLPCRSVTPLARNWSRAFVVVVVTCLAHHREKSSPVMEALYAWADEPFERRRVEPNSGLGAALR